MGGVEFGSSLDMGADNAVDDDEENVGDAILSQWWFEKQDDAEPTTGYVADVEDEDEVLEQLREEIRKQR